MTEYLDEREVSRITRLSLSTLRNWRFLRKNLPYCKIGRAVRYNSADVNRFMEQRKISII